MGTYAVYRIWAGVTKAELEGIEHPFLERVLSAYQDVEQDGLSFTAIDMHGEVVGVGVEVTELNWEVEIGEANHFDLAIGTKAAETQQRVTQVFKNLGIPLEATLYQHIDLGG